ncbi:MAG: hypothetical protein U9N59_07965 [Campylobacterota bacterium]|nr:hypothetical protein [Campylobacterota bacterium]
MFSKNKKQYVNVLKQNKQLKLNYTTLQDTKILKNEQSSFLITDDNMPDDALFKLDTLQKTIPHTYLVSLFEGSSQKIIQTSNIDVIGYESIKLDKNLSIVIPKNEIISACRYFTASGIDYILSPFSILNEYIQDKGNKNSLNVLVYNDVVYIIILDNLKQVVHSVVKNLTPFDEIQDDSFTQDDIVGQKLYEEVHFLEIQQFLNEVTQNYYKENKNIDFLETVDFLYTLKPLNDDQMKSLYETIMVKINYKPINIDTYINSLTAKETSQNYNFTDVRVKKESGNMFIWLLFAIISMSIAAAVLYYKMINDKDIKQKENITIEQKVKQVAKKIEQKPIIKDTTIDMPNHIVENNNMSQNIRMLLDIVPYDAVLKDLKINKNSSTYVVNFIAQDSSLEDMQSKLLNIYKKSEILLEHKNKAILNTIIENNTLAVNNKNTQLYKYKKDAFLSTSKATQYIKNNLPRNSTIKYISKDTKEYLTYNFTITSLVKSPKEFFDFIENLNKQNLSATISYPILFSKLNNALEIKYNIKMHQQNKKSVKPKK